MSRRRRSTSSRTVWITGSSRRMVTFSCASARNLLHIYGRNPMKNTERVIAAYARLPEASRPDLVVISP